ncbi:unnamed protein product [Durusdinium trenchii]|uniref:Uncharacterized protein n=1 Tax=Durusdinium trenchii TaxID=1381693 RepID=A0ABP0LB15_9DINO
MCSELCRFKKTWSRSRSVASLKQTTIWQLYCGSSCRFENMLNNLCARSRGGHRRMRARVIWKEGSGWIVQGTDGLTRTSLLPRDKTTQAVCQGVPRNSARIFLRELHTQRYLSVAQNNRSVQVVMTQQPGSLFVAHVRTGREERNRIGFQHEGLPACGSFLRAHWHLQEVFGFTGTESRQMQCDGHYFDSTDEFKWHPDATLQSLGETILALEQK